MDTGTILFYAFSLLALVGAVGLITNRHPVNTVVLVVLNFFALGGLYLTLAAQFLAVVQIIVYAGAIMVLFLFVVMLLNLRTEDMDEVKLDARRGVAFILGLGFLGMMLYALQGVGSLQMPTVAGPDGRPMPVPFQYGSVEAIGRLLFTEYLFPFEMVSVVLLSALMGAVAIARKHQ